MNLTNKKRRKAATAGALLLAVMLTMSACGANANNSNNGGTPNNSETGAPVDQLPDENGVQEPGAPTNDDDNTTTDNNSNSSEEAAPISAEGTYVGLIDNNSLEITTDGVAAAYRIPEELHTTIQDLPADAKVKFEYTEKAVEGETDLKQLWLTKIEVVQ